ncbi:MAG: alpha/beta fold hydrolase [Bdellovibrionales bacterium]
MKKIIIGFLFFSFSAFAGGESLLDSEAQVTGFGKVKYRAPAVQGEGFPIVLFHGIYGGASHRTWRALLPELESQGKTVYIMDLPGAGESEKPAKVGDDGYKISDFDIFVEKFLEEVVGESSIVVSESILSNAALRVSAARPDLVRRVVLINPSGVTSLNEPPSQREQGEFERFSNNDDALIARYQGLLIENSIKFFLKFGFYDDSLVNADLVSDFTVMRDNIDQRYLTLSFITGQLYRPFEESAQGVFKPVLGIFGAEYEGFQGRRPATAADFQQIRPDFNFIEIENSGSSVQREKPSDVAREIIIFAEDD